jgi:preprotein translocase subunit SecG
MDNAQKIILIIHTLIALSIIALVLLQRGKGADAGAGFGAGASGTVFGARGSGSFFSRMTAVMATAFFISSLTLAYLSSQRPREPESLLQGSPVLEEAAEEAPVLEETAPEGDMPALEPAAGEVVEGAAEMPALEPEAPAEEDTQ